MKTYAAKRSEIQRKWFLVDFDGSVLGRSATLVANLLMGKGKPCYSPHLDCGDHVIVVNAEKVRLTGKKLQTKMYRRHSQFPGGLKETAAEALLKKAPQKVILHAVKGMLPKNKLGRAMLKKLRVYAGAEHPHEAQMPIELKLNP